jgi:hypothetical protein
MRGTSWSHDFAEKKDARPQPVLSALSVEIHFLFRKARAHHTTLVRNAHEHDL